MTAVAGSANIGANEEDCIWIVRGVAAVGVRLCGRGVVYSRLDADDWDVIRDCHEKSMREAKGKFKPAGAGFTMDRDKVCGDY